MGNVASLTNIQTLEYNYLLIFQLILVLWYIAIVIIVSSETGEIATLAVRCSLTVYTFYFLVDTRSAHSSVNLSLHENPLGVKFQPNAASACASFDC